MEGCFLGRFETRVSAASARKPAAVHESDAPIFNRDTSPNDPQKAARDEARKLAIMRRRLNERFKDIDADDRRAARERTLTYPVIKRDRARTDVPQRRRIVVAFCRKVAPSPTTPGVEMARADTIRVSTLFASLLAASFFAGGAASAQEGGAYSGHVARHAAAHGLPPSLVHRVIMRESRYNPRAVSKGNYGMMQIRLGTARGMGYRGGAAGLLDADTNMTYAVKYLAGAYRAAGGNADRAVALYARGYYDVAKRQGSSARELAGMPMIPAQARAAYNAPMPRFARGGGRALLVSGDRSLGVTTARGSTPPQ